MIPYSADKHKLKRGILVFEILTFNCGVSWFVSLRRRRIQHTNRRGRVCFESPPKFWHCGPAGIGDNRIFIDPLKAQQECIRRNKCSKR